jgi:hypothetical protein
LRLDACPVAQRSTAHQRSTTITTVLARRLPWCRRDLLTATGETAHRSVSTSDSWFVKAKLEGLFADELALLQPTSGYMRLLKESVLQIWKARKAAVSEEIAIAERSAKAIQDKLNRLDEAFLFERSIDIETYGRHAEKLREELTLARIDPAPAFSYLRTIEDEKERMVDQNNASWNHVHEWLSRLDAVRRAA